MAVNLNADMLVILTNIEQAELFYGTENARKLGEISVEEAKSYIADGHFAKGSMLPKVQAAVDFVEKTNHRAIITSLTNLSNAIQGIRATIIKN